MFWILPELDETIKFDWNHFTKFLLFVSYYPLYGSPSFYIIRVSTSAVQRKGYKKGSLHLQVDCSILRLYLTSLGKRCGVFFVCTRFINLLVMLSRLSVIFILRLANFVKLS